MAFGFGDDPSRPTDPVVLRLFPDGYRDDDEAADEFRRFTERSLRDGQGEQCGDGLGIPGSSRPDGLGEGGRSNARRSGFGWIRPRRTHGCGRSPTCGSPSAPGSGSRRATKRTGNRSMTATPVGIPRRLRVARLVQETLVRALSARHFVDAVRPASLVGRADIGRACVDAIIAHARRDHPDEACGVSPGPRVATGPERFVPMINAERSPTFYEFDSASSCGLYKEMDDRTRSRSSSTTRTPRPRPTRRAPTSSYASEPQAHYVLVSTRSRTSSASSARTGSSTAWSPRKRSTSDRRGMITRSGAVARPGDDH